jgi:hypothetical protein
MAGPQGPLCHLLDGSGIVTRLAGWRASDSTSLELPLEGKAQKRIGMPAAREMPEIVAASGSTAAWCKTRALLDLRSGSGHPRIVSGRISKKVAHAPGDPGTFEYHDGGRTDQRRQNTFSQFLWSVAPWLVWFLLATRFKKTSAAGPRDAEAVNAQRLQYAQN